MARTTRTAADPDRTGDTPEHPEATQGAAAHVAHDAHEIHLPPNSWSPIALALALTIFFVGFLIGPAAWIVGALLTTATLVAWARSAMTEYSELPDEL